MSSLIENISYYSQQILGYFLANEEKSANEEKGTKRKRERDDDDTTKIKKNDDTTKIKKKKGMKRKIKKHKGTGSMRWRENTNRWVTTTGRKFINKTKFRKKKGMKKENTKRWATTTGKRFIEVRFSPRLEEKELEKERFDSLDCYEKYYKLYEALKRSDIKIIKDLIEEKGLDANIIGGETGGNVLHHLKKGQAHIADYLIAKAADVENEGSVGCRCFT